MTTTGGRELLLSSPAGTDNPQSGRVCVTFDRTAVHLFDKKTGQRIDMHANVNEIPGTAGQFSAQNVEVVA
jgi:hypothetical protein